jgi:hypothetical protein
MEPEGYKFDCSEVVVELPPQQEPLTCVESDAALSFDDNSIPPEIFTDIIIPFIGDYYYRFVGMVNHVFHDAYVSAFPKKRTHFNVTTKEHAIICYQESDRDISFPILCPLLARKGDLACFRTVLVKQPRVVRLLDPGLVP